MTPLPPPLGDVIVPDCFSPSALGSPLGCSLKLVIASLRRDEWRERLASGPEAAVGTLFHRVLERASREAGASPDDIFRQEYDRSVEALRSDPQRAHFADLASTKSLVEWNRVKARALARVDRDAAPNPFSGSSSRGRSRRTFAGSEIALESLTLRLRGKADRIRAIARGIFEVRDFKTGAVLDEQGEIKDQIVLQLRAYGLMLLERLPDCKVRLVVDDGEERQVSFNVDERLNARQVFQGIAERLPPPGPTSAASLASPGSSCWGCQVRHACLAYRESAPAWWKQYPAGVAQLPNDIWGVVLDVLEVGRGRVNVLLHDNAGRRVRVDGIDPRHGITSQFVGSQMWFFGLEASGATRGFDGGRFHPRSFHELPRDRLERRAWVLHVFGEVREID